MSTAPRLTRILVAYGLASAEAEDVVQETMFQLYRDWDRISRIDRPDLYARKAALNLVTRLWRRRSRFSNIESANSTLNESASGGEDRALGKRTVLDLLALLPRREQQVFALIFDGYTPTEIAEMLDLSPSSVRSSLAMARRKLRAMLEQADN